MTKNEIKQLGEISTIELKTSYTSLIASSQKFFGLTGRTSLSRDLVV